MLRAAATMRWSRSHPIPRWARSWGQKASAARSCSSGFRSGTWVPKPEKLKNRWLCRPASPSSTMSRNSFMTLALVADWSVIKVISESSKPNKSFSNEAMSRASFAQPCNLAEGKCWYQLIPTHSALRRSMGILLGLGFEGADTGCPSLITVDSDGSEEDCGIPRTSWEPPGFTIGPLGSGSSRRGGSCGKQVAASKESPWPTIRKNPG